VSLGRGFKSHPVHFFLLYNYGIILNSIWIIVGQKPSNASMRLIEISSWWDV
jgi:hypothetical protein